MLKLFNNQVTGGNFFLGPIPTWQQVDKMLP